MNFLTLRLALLLISLSVAGSRGLSADDTHGDDRDKTPSFRLVTQESPVTASLRGATISGTGEVWITGSDGTVIRSSDRGQSWHCVPVPNAENLDFRDVELLPDDDVLLMSAGPGNASQVLRSSDDGKSWRVVLENNHPDGFFDGMSFDSKGELGALYGDAIDGRFAVYLTEDGGEVWKLLEPSQRPSAQPDEHGFAASGTGIVVRGPSIQFVTGGSVARVVTTTDRGLHWSFAETPLPSGSPSTGVFSIAILDSKRSVIVGGDYLAPQNHTHNVARFIDGEGKWTGVDSKIEHRASVRSLGRGRLLACGRTGVAVSLDAGEHWQTVSTQGYFTATVDERLHRAYLAGSEGRLAILEWDETASAAPKEGNVPESR